MATEYPPFHNPKDFGIIDISTSQIGKALTFDWDTDIIPGCKIVAEYKGDTVATYEVGSGITLSQANRRAVLVLNGSDFATYEDRTVDFFCNFFFLGDVEVIFHLKIVNSPL